MASKIPASAAVFLSLNLLFFAVVSGCNAGCPTPTPTPTPPKPSPTPKPPKPSPPSAKCPVDTLKLGVCANVLNLIKAKVGKPPKYPCCSLLEGLVDLEAAVCLCTAIKANILGIKFNIPVDLTLLVNFCGKKVPKGFKCP